MQVCLGVGSTRILIEIELRRARSKFQSLVFDSLGHKTKSDSQKNENQIHLPEPDVTFGVLYKRSPRISILHKQFVQIYVLYPARKSKSSSLLQFKPMQTENIIHTHWISTELFQKHGLVHSDSKDWKQCMYLSSFDGWNEN